MFIKVLQCLVLCMLACTIIPTHVLATDKAIACSKDKDGNITKNYYSVSDAMNASRQEGGVYMLDDWDIGAQINIVEGTTSIIYMDGHIIKKSNGKLSGNCEGGIFTIHPNAKLYLYGSTNEEKLKDSKGNEIETGGLVTGGYATHGGAVYMKEGAKLYLTNVAISGNSTDYKGGGIYIAGEDVEIWMDNAHIDHNWAGSSGGGIYSEADGTHIHMKNNSTINYNQGNKTGSSGGGVCFRYSWFSIEGDDDTYNEISYNKVVMGDYGDGTSGGGIHVAAKQMATNYGLIRNLKITHNFAGYGGGVDNCARYTILQDVTITDNESKIRGGGVAVVYDVDLYVRGNVKITNNKRTDGAVDDVFLQTAFGQAYVRASGLSSSSLIGIRTEDSGDTLVVKDISDTSLISCFYMSDYKDFHIGYQASDKQLWQRTGATSYTVKVNDQPVGKYAEGNKVTVVDNNTDASKIFTSWIENSYVKDPSDLKSETLTFTMPAHDVDLKANYTAGASELALSLASFTNDQTLPTTGTFSWKFGDETYSEQVDLKWYKKENGTFVSCAKEDKAESGTVYVFEVCVEPKTEDGIHVIASNVAKENVTVKYGDNGTVGLSELSLNDEGTLNFKSNEILVGEDKIKYVDPIVVSVREGASRREVVTAINNATTTIATSYNGREYNVQAKAVDIDEEAYDSWFDEKGENGKIVMPENANPSSCYTKTLEIYKEGVDKNRINVDEVNDVMLVVMVLPNNDGTDDTKPSQPDLYDNDSWTNEGSKFKKIKTNYNDYQKDTVYLLYYDEGDSGVLKWNFKQLFEQQIEAKSNTYKEVKAFAWVVENGNMSEIASKTYILDNLTRSSFGTSFISSIKVDMGPIEYGKALPSKINSINVTLSNDRVDSYSDLGISWNSDDTTALNNKSYIATVELNNIGGYSADYLSSLHVEVNKDDRIYAYIKNEDGKAKLYIIFPELEGSTGDYNDVALSYTLNDIKIGDYTSEISYEEACKLNNDLKNYVLPNVILSALNNNKNKEGKYTESKFTGDVSYKIVSAFNKDNYDCQEIVIEGTINKPSYLNFNGLSNTFTLRIKTRAKVGYTPEEVVNKVVTCEEYMKSKDWTWSETKKACVYKVSNTNSK